MKKNITISLLFFFIIAKSQTHISGTLFLDIDNGVIEGKIKMSDFPHNKQLSIILHKGMNIKFIKENGKIIYPNPKELVDDFNIRYNLHSWVNDNKVLPSLSDIYIEYSGKFPTYNNDEEAGDDDMGVVAIKDGILRTTTQYPIIPFFIEKENGKSLSKQTYDLQVLSNQKITVYLNGCDTQKGKKMHFKNNVPLDFLMYAGTFNTLEVDKVKLLNTKLTKDDAIAISNEINSIREFYSQQLGIAYNSEVVLPQIFTIGPKNQYTGWGFTVSPTIVLDYNSIQSKIINGKLNDNGFIKTIAHEMGHNYFGGILKVPDNLWRFYNESISQYLSFKYMETKSRPDYLKFLKEATFTDKYKSQKFPNYYEIEKTEKNITNASYDYYYLFLFGFEKEFGKEKMFELLRQMLKNASAYTEYNSDFFRINAMKTGISEQQWTNFNEKYLKSENCIKEFDLNAM